MLTIYKSNSMKDAARYVLESVKKVDKSNLAVTHTIIVPDRASMEAERALLKEVGGSFNVRVKTFRRLANDILPKFEYLSKQAGIMALYGIIRDNRDKLVCYKKGVDTLGFAEDMFETISMMKYCRISPQRLINGNLPKSVQGKARDVALLYQAYLDFSRGRFVDSSDKLDLLIENLPSSDVVKNGDFYLYDFDNFSAQEFALVEQLALCSKGVTVACCVGKNKGDKYLYLDDIYNGLLDICKRNGITPDIREGENYSNEYVRQIGENLYRYNDCLPMESDGFVEIFRGDTRAQEVYALACRIQQYVRSGGRFRDVYVATSDINSYFNAVTLTFPQFEIPFFCDRQFSLAAQPYARFVTDYLSVYRSKGRLDSVLAFVKNYLFCGGFEKAEAQDDGVYQFENYCLKYNVDYRYDKFTLGKDEPFFGKADKFRRKFYELYRQVAVPQKATVNQYAEVIRKLIEVARLNERNAEFAERQRKAGLTAEAKVTDQTADKFNSVLLQAESVLGEREVSLDEFIKIFLSGLQATNISVLPVTNDCVIFANMAKARKHDVKFLAMLGANYGAMPIVKRDCKLFSDANIKSLAEAGVNVEPQIFVENKRERFSLFQLLLEPTEKLYVSYAASDGGEALAPSPFVEELSRLFTVNGKPLAPDELACEDVFTEKQALSKLALNSRKLKDKQMVNMPSYKVLRKKYGKEIETYEFVKDGKSVRVTRGAELYLKKSATSVSQLTDFFKCPYRFYVQYGLNVKPRPVAELKTADLGTILHDVLEHYVRDVDVNEPDSATEQKALACFEFAMANDFYTGMRNDVKMTGTIEQLKAESVRMCKVVKRQLAKSEFQNYKTELSFGDDGEAAPVEVEFDGGKFALKGKIDRVDVYGDRFIVIDYKSGKVASDYGEKELYVGHKLQLPVYVRAVENHTGKRPAGFYYFNMHDRFAKPSESKVYYYKGRTLNDRDIACALDSDLQNGKSEKLGLSLNKDGGLSSRGGNLLSDEQFGNQIEYAFLLIKAAGNLMQKGYAAVNPCQGTCDYCDYKDICDFNDVYAYKAREVKGKISASNIDKVVENEKRK